MKSAYKYLVYLFFSALPVVSFTFGELNLGVEKSVKKAEVLIKKEYERITNPKPCTLNHELCTSNHEKIKYIIWGIKLYYRDIVMIPIFLILIITNGIFIKLWKTK